jgi:hypothetical protein
MPDVSREDMSFPSAHRINWFGPDRGVEGTVYVRPAGQERPREESSRPTSRTSDDR